MKRSLLLVYTVCSVLMITGSVLWFVFTLRSDSSLGKAEALKSFKGFTKQTADILYDPSVQNDPVRLHVLLEQLCRNHHKYIQTVLIRHEADTLFVWPKNTDIFSYTGRNTVEIKNMPLFFSAAQTHIPAHNENGTITIHAALQTLSVENIFNRGQTVFILILILFLMTITLLVISYLDILSPAKKAAHFTRNEQKTPAADPLDEYSITAQGQEEVSSTVPDSVPEQPVKKPERYFSTDLKSLDRLHFYQDRTQEEPTHSDYDTEPELLDEISSAPAGRTEDDFNAEHYGCFENCAQAEKADCGTSAAQTVPCVEPPLTETAAGNEKHSLERAKLIEELTTAITETAVAEEDLTLLLVHANDLTHNQRIIHSVRTTLDRIHKIFIFNENTLGLIIFYAPLDRAMQIASKLYDDVCALLDISNKHSLGIGLTTRAGRLIPAHRMIEEASAAIEKAIEEGSDPIVAFRVNPEKYRRCLARLN